MEKQEQEAEDANPVLLSKMSSPPQKPEFESTTTSPTTPQKNYSPPQEPELEPTSRNSPTKIFSPPPQPDESKPLHASFHRDPQSGSISLYSISPNPPTKILSPPFEPEVELTNSNSPPKMISPPLEHHHSSKTQSTPLDLSTEEEEYHKKSPFKSVISPDADMVSPVTTKVGPTSQEVDAQRDLRPNLTILKKANGENMVALLGFRVCGFVFSLVSFSVLAADRNRGWALDSFYRYKEFRYCVAVNVIAFAYSGFQAYDLVYQLTSGKRKLMQHLRYYFDFSVDQILSYLLLSASSSAAVRVDDWQSNWGKDEFPDMARASVALSFLGFVALALGSLVSGYTLCTLKSM